LARLAGDQRGSYALEFAMIAPLFLILVLETVDVGLTCFTQIVLDGAARDAARQVRTLQISGSGTSSQQAFDAVLCSDTAALIPCASITFYVGTMTVFSNSSSIPSYAPPVSPQQDTNPSGANFSPGGFNGSAQTFSSGSPGGLVAVRVAYNRPSLIPFANAIGIVGGNLNLASLQSTTLVSTVVFRNEP